MEPTLNKYTEKYEIIKFVEIEIREIVFFYVH